MSEVEDLKKTMLAKRQKAVPYSREDWLSSGLDLVNLAVSGLSYGCYLKGHYYLMPGASRSGKTWLANEALAQAVINPNFDDYRKIYDGPEKGAIMDRRKYFGKLADEWEPPRGTREEPEDSRTVEEFYYNLYETLKLGPCVYILDSMDALSSTQETDKFMERMSAADKARSGKKVPKVSGTYGDGKPIQNSSNMRVVLNLLQETKSILIIIAQERDTFGFGVMPGQKSRSGGHALTFYAAVEMWTSLKGKVLKKVGPKMRKIGTRCKVQVKKNRIVGRDRVVEFPILDDHGIDNTGANVDYLLEEGHWKKVKGKGIVASELDFSGDREGLVELIEENAREKELTKLVAKVWREVESKSKLKRKPRYECQ